MAAVLKNTVLAAGTVNGVTSAAISTTDANLLVAFAADINDSNPVTVSDSQSNTWTPLTQRTTTPNRARLYYCASPTTNGSHTFTIACTGGQPILVVWAFSGMHASPLDQESAGGGAGSGTSVQPGSITPTEDNYVLIGGVNFRGGNTGSVNGGFTGSFTNFSFSNHCGGGGAYLIQTSKAAANPTFSWSGSNANVAAMASFKVASSIGPIAMHHRRMHG